MEDFMNIVKNEKDYTSSDFLPMIYYIKKQFEIGNILRIESEKT